MKSLLFVNMDQEADNINLPDNPEVVRLSSIKHVNSNVAYDNIYFYRISPNAMDHIRRKFTANAFIKIH